VPEDIAGSKKMTSGRVRGLRERAVRHQSVATVARGLTISELSSGGMIGLAEESITRALEGGF
jgi:hypothetical protein